MNNDFPPFNSNAYVAHYTTIEAVFKILDNDAIRLSCKENANDVYENNLNWFFDEGFLGDMEINSIFKCIQIKKQIELRVNKSIQTFSTIGYQEGRTLFNKPRAWAQYGNNHQGVCLIFDKEELNQKFKKNNQIIEFISEKISYIDWLELIEGTQVSYSYPYDIDELEKLLDNSKLLYEEVNKNYNLQTKLFRKDIDWEQENEYRWLAYSKTVDNIYIKYKDSLKAIILGCNVNNRIRDCFISDNIKLYQISYNDDNRYEYRKLF